MRLDYRLPASRTLPMHSLILLPFRCRPAKLNSAQTNAAFVYLHKHIASIYTTHTHTHACIHAHICVAECRYVCQAVPPSFYPSIRLSAEALSLEDIWLKAFRASLPLVAASSEHKNALKRQTERQSKEREGEGADEGR